MVPVGIYDSLGCDAVKFIIKQTDVELIFADNLQRVRNLIQWKDEILALKIIVTFVEPTDELIKLAEEKKLKLLTLDKLREIGRNNPIDFVPPKASDTAVIMYTSGSTGEPKGRKTNSFIYVFQLITSKSRLYYFTR
jgi:long-chain acyl-CoA synthetase